MTRGAGSLPRRGGSPPLEAVLLDAGQTLIRELTPPGAVAAAAAAEVGLAVPAAALNAAMAAAAADVASRWHVGAYWHREDAVRALFTDAYARALAADPSAAPGGAGRGAADRLHALADAIYRQYGDAQHWQVYDDVPETIAALRAAGVPIGVVSDWGHGLEAILLDLAVGGQIDTLVVSSRLGLAKPDAALFQVAIDRLGVRPAGTVHVGDTYTKDVVGARAAGIVPVLIDRERRHPPFDCAVIHDLRELRTILAL